MARQGPRSEKKKVYMYIIIKWFGPGGLSGMEYSFEF